MSAGPAPQVVVRHRRAAVLGGAGASFGALAGALQVSVGSRIPTWSGDKLRPVPLGLLTIALSLLAAVAAVRQTRSDLGTGGRAGCAVGMLLPGLLCFTTVGRLWYPAGALLLLGGVSSLDSASRTALMIGRDWQRCLIGVLGVSQLLMAANAPRVTAVVGVVGGLAVIAAVCSGLSRTATSAVVLSGAVPFALLAWTAVVPVVVAVLAGVLAATLPAAVAGSDRSLSPTNPGHP